MDEVSRQLSLKEIRHLNCRLAVRHLIHHLAVRHLVRHLAVSISLTDTYSFL